MEVIINAVNDLPDIEIVFGIIFGVFMLIRFPAMYLFDRSIKRLNEKFNHEHPEVNRVFNNLHAMHIEDIKEEVCIDV